MGLAESWRRSALIVGISGSIGGLLAERLLERDWDVRGLVRTEGHQDRWRQHAVQTTIGDLTIMTVDDLATAFLASSVAIFAAGSNGSHRATTDAVDDDGLAKTVTAAGIAQVQRLVLVSVMPEAWRDRGLSDDEEHYFATKKKAELLVTRSSLDWLIVRPSLLLDKPGTGLVTLGPAEIHHGIPRADVAATLAELVAVEDTYRRILELDAGPVPISTAVQRMPDA